MIDGLEKACPLRRFAAVCSDAGPFVLVDIGCSGGLDDLWRELGPRLTGIGFDANIDEIERLRSIEANPRLRYEAMYLGLPEGHPLRRGIGMRSLSPERNPWSRLMVARLMALREQRRQAQEREWSSEEVLAFNAWTNARLADPKNVIVAADFLREIGIRTVDFLKIDVDSVDFEILQSFEPVFDEMGILGVAYEVNFYGSGAPDENSFANVDRLLKRANFTLIALSTRRYPRAVLPATPRFGQPLQGDAIYLRDLLAEENEAFARRLSPGRKFNAAVLHASFGAPDVAAEIVLRYRTELASICDTDLVLDLLAEQVQEGREEMLDCESYVERCYADAAAQIDPPEMRRARRLVAKARRSGKGPFAIYGTGRGGMSVKSAGAGSNISFSCFVDSRKELDGREFMGLPVLSLDHARKKGISAFIVASKAFRDEICLSILNVYADSASPPVIIAA